MAMVGALWDAWGGYPEWDHVPRIGGAIVEHMEHSPGHKGKPNDLIDLGAISGAAACLLTAKTPTQLVRPHTWKGQRSKAADHTHTRKIMGWVGQTHAAGVLAAQVPEGFPNEHLKELMDAVGLALYGLGLK
jgi:hypothetical protein